MTTYYCRKYAKFVQNDYFMAKKTMVYKYVDQNISVCPSDYRHFFFLAKPNSILRNFSCKDRNLIIDS